MQTRKTPIHCTECGQIDQGQTGEYPCGKCGLPTAHDKPQAQTKPLTEERIDEIRKSLMLPNEDGNIWLDEITDPQEILALISMLTPPPDAAVREAVEWFEGFRRCTAENNAIGRKDYIIDHIDTLLRAVPKKHPGIKPPQITAAIRAQVEANQFVGNDGVTEFTPLPATWLNQGRWADPILPKRRGTGSTVTDQNMRAAQEFVNMVGG